MQAIVGVPATGTGHELQFQRQILQATATTTAPTHPSDGKGGCRYVV